MISECWYYCPRRDAVRKEWQALGRLSEPGVGQGGRDEGYMPLLEFADRSIADKFQAQVLPVAKKALLS